MAIGAASTASAGVVDETALLARARVQLHYLASGCFLREGQLLEHAHGIRVPAIVVQGRTDMVCPPVTAFDLSGRLPNAQLRVIEQAGHSASGQRLAPALRNAADDMRTMVAATA